jgi:hypothetical protein
MCIIRLVWLAFSGRLLMSENLFSIDPATIATALGELNNQDSKKPMHWATASPYFANITPSQQQKMPVGLPPTKVGARCEKVANNPKLKHGLETVLEEMVLAKDDKFRASNPAQNIPGRDLPDPQSYYVFLPPDKPGPVLTKHFLFMPPDNTVKPQQECFFPSGGQHLPFQTK